jgi:hypothetical protein
MLWEEGVVLWLVLWEIMWLSLFVKALLLLEIEIAGFNPPLICHFGTFVIQGAPGS